jgi:hypothetical protein
MLLCIQLVVEAQHTLAGCVEHIRLAACGHASAGHAVGCVRSVPVIRIKKIECLGLLSRLSGRCQQTVTVSSHPGVQQLTVFTLTTVQAA